MIDRLKEEDGGVKRHCLRIHDLVYMPFAFNLAAVDQSEIERLLTSTW